MKVSERKLSHVLFYTLLAIFVTLFITLLRYYLFPQSSLPQHTRIPLSSSTNCEEALALLSSISSSTPREFAEDIFSLTKPSTFEPFTLQAARAARAARAAKRLLLLSEKSLAAAEVLKEEIDPYNLYGDKEDRNYNLFGDKEDRNSFFEDLDSNGRPIDSSVKCYMQSDSSDLCIYENICIDIPSDVSMPQNPTLLFIKSPNKNIETETLDPLLSTLDKEALHASSLRHISRSNRPLNLKMDSLTIETKSKFKLSWDFEDIQYENSPGEIVRDYPFGSDYIIREIEPENTIPTILGGTFDGSITWLDDFYLTTNILSSHLWGSSMSILFPIIGASHANHSLNLQLPPLNNLIITAAEDEMTNFAKNAWKDGHPWSEEVSFDWAFGFLEELLDWISIRTNKLNDNDNKRGLFMPFLGSKSRNSNMKEMEKTVHYRKQVHDHIQERIKSSISMCNNVEKGELNGIDDYVLGSEKLDKNDEPLVPFISCLVRSMKSTIGNFTPFRGLISGTQKLGTRLIFTSKDLPDDLVTQTILTELSSRGARLETILKMNRYFLRRPHRICAKRAVVLGSKELLIGGQAEATFIRKFAADRLGTPLMNSQYIFPPTKQVLLIDRGNNSPSNSAHYGRFFDNIEEMRNVLFKYKIQYNFITDKDLSTMSFIEQGKLFASHGVLIIAHGAAMVNAAFMPPRSAILEINPYNMWCPIYTRGLRAAGHHVFSLNSKLKGRNLNYAYLLGRVSLDEIKENAEKEAKRCEGKGNVEASTDGDCWMSYKTSSILVPIAEFEHLLLQALEAIGDYRYPISSPIALLEGVEEERGDSLSQLDENYYRSRRWTVCKQSQG